MANAKPDSAWVLPFACAGNRADGVRLLCEAGCSPLTRDPMGVLGVSLACMFGCPAALEELMAQAGAGFEAAELSQALHFAVMLTCRGEIVQQLIHRRADINDQWKLKRMTPLGIAVQIKSLQHRMGRFTTLTKLLGSRQQHLLPSLPFCGLKPKVVD